MDVINKMFGVSNTIKPTKHELELIEQKMLINKTRRMSGGKKKKVKNVKKIGGKKKKVVSKKK